VVLILEATFLAKPLTATASVVYLNPILTASVWKHSTLSPEERLSPRREKDEWYQERHKPKYKKYNRI
jgi:hypothetical protein